MPTITNITKQKKSDRLYNIFVDDKFAMGISDLQLSLLGLKIGQEISQDKLINLQKDAADQKAYHRALYYLKFGARSEKEMSDYLTGKGFTETSITAAINRLKKDKLIDDVAFAASWLKNRLEFRHYPLARIRLELYRKGIDKEVVEEEISALDGDAEISSLQQLIEQKKRQSKYREPPKLMAYLVGKGFSYGLVKQALEQNLSGEGKYFHENADNNKPEQT